MVHSVIATSETSLTQPPSPPNLLVLRRRKLAIQMDLPTLKPKGLPQPPKPSPKKLFPLTSPNDDYEEVPALWVTPYVPDYVHVVSDEYRALPSNAVEVLQLLFSSAKFIQEKLSNPNTFGCHPQPETSTAMPIDSVVASNVQTLVEDTSQDLMTIAPSTTLNTASIPASSTSYGHTETVEDVQFCPSSVGDDSRLILWDARVGSSPVVKVDKAHRGDLHCVDWSPHDINFILTGSADNTIHLFDRRNLKSGEVGSPIYKFEGHDAPVLVGKTTADSTDSKEPNTSPGLFFRHAGHRDKVVDIHWNASNPWTIVSVSDDCESSGGSGTLQKFGMSKQPKGYFKVHPCVLNQGFLGCVHNMVDSTLMA
ncbi:hypothetical protein Fmac_028880 [Flemingia macrophylla]|uniref:Uncharacterized protein n=1 Tax=Flemingia macrophylla TaxID=520843 RepID=A0ABD1L8V8_9FABA